MPIGIRPFFVAGDEGRGTVRIASITSASRPRSLSRDTWWFPPRDATQGIRSRRLAELCFAVPARV
ncbi:hypothetical protein ACTJJP_05490 [Microbacterium sp. 22296]